MSDRAKLHFDPKQKQKTTIRPAGNATQKATIKRSGSEKQDARPAAQFKTTPQTNKGLGAKS
jgi:hypothetical protein